MIGWYVVLMGHPEHSRGPIFDPFGSLRTSIHSLDLPLECGRLDVEKWRHEIVFSIDRAFSANTRIGSEENSIIHESIRDYGADMISCSSRSSDCQNSRLDKASFDASKLVVEECAYLLEQLPSTFYKPSSPLASRHQRPGTVSAVLQVQDRQLT